MFYKTLINRLLSNESTGAKKTSTTLIKLLQIILLLLTAWLLTWWLIKMLMIHLCYRPRCIGGVFWNRPRCFTALQVMYTPCKDHSEGRGAALIYIVINAFFKGSLHWFYTWKSVCSSWLVLSLWENKTWCDHAFLCGASLSADIHGPQMMNRPDFVDPVFLLVPPLG